MAQEIRTAERHGATERVRRLREESLGTQPRIYMERAVLETEAYKKWFQRNFLFPGKTIFPAVENTSASSAR